MFLFALLLTSPSSAGDDCVYDAVPTASRASIGQAVLAKRPKDGDVLDALQKATDGCAIENDWSVDQTLKANGYASMRFTADTIADRLGHRSWSETARKAVRARPTEQLKTLAGTGGGGAEFELVLAQMIGDDPSLPGAIRASTDDAMRLFVLMVKLQAVGELERLQLSTR